MSEVAPLPAADERLDPSAEPRWRRWLYLVVAVAVTAGVGFFLSSFFAPALGRPGIDENAYTLAGRNIAFHGTAGFRPADDYQYVGAMWVRTEDATFAPPGWVPGFVRDRLTVHTEAGWYYPKYPAGLPLLNGIAWRVGEMWGGTKRVLAGADAALAVSSVSMTLAVLGMFFLARAAVGSSFLGVLAMFALFCTPTSLEMAGIPGSHSPALVFVVWGMFFLVSFVQTGSAWRGAAAGFLLGCAVTMRYTEALLLFPLYPLDQVLSDTGIKANHPHWWKVISVCRLLPVGPVGIAALMAVRWKRMRSYFAAVTPLLAWAVPVGALVTYNWFTMGHLTGYDTTNESVGFSTAEFLKKWDFAVAQVNFFGLFLLAPLGFVGLILMYRRAPRVALLMTLWFVPGALLYTAYYWGTQAPGVGFLRFFLTLFPPLIVGAMWTLRVAGEVAGKEGRGSVAGPIAAGAVVAAAAGVAMMGSITNVERQHRGNMNLRYSAGEIARVMAREKSGGAGGERAMVFADEGLFPQLLQYAQFAIDADWYTSDAFQPRGGGGFGILGMMQDANKDPNSENAPVLIQPSRIKYMEQVRGAKNQEELAAEQRRLMDAALGAGRPVYAVLTANQAAEFRSLFLEGGTYELIEKAKWSEPCSVRVEGRNGVVREQRRRGEPANNANPLAPPLWLGEPVIRWQPQALTMYEIRRKGVGPASSRAAG